MTHDSQVLLHQSQALLAKWAQKSNTPEENRLDVWLSSDHLVSAVEALVDARWGYLASITALDNPADNMMEVIYHLCSRVAVLGLRVIIGRDVPVVPSICDVIPSATLLEREIIEMFGITITNTPDTNHLYLPDNWRSGVYPMRKDARLDNLS